MESLLWIIGGGLLMSLIATVGIFAAVLPEPIMSRLLVPLLALAAGTMLGSAFFHMLPQAIAGTDPLAGLVWVAAGFTAFLAIEQFLHWHHTHTERDHERQPYTYLILIGDGIHNFLGGLSIAATFLISPQAGITAWIAAAAHEVPQELGDFGVLVHGGWNRRLAIIWNFLSALTFPLGAVLAWFLAQRIDVAPLVLFGAGSFIYIVASDLIPEIKHESSLPKGLIHFAIFVAGLALTYLIAQLQHSH